LGELALARAREPQFNWEAVAEQFHNILMETVTEGRQVPVGLEVGQ
jgi:type II secretory pathway predicted ATPase ExeA